MVVCFAYVVVASYLCYKKGKSALRGILIILTVSNLFYLVVSVIMFSNKCQDLIDDPPETLSNWTLAFWILSRQCTFYFFFLGYWCLFYKYWEFSLFFNKEKPTVKNQKIVNGLRYGTLVVTAIAAICEGILLYINLGKEVFTDDVPPTPCKTANSCI